MAIINRLYSIIFDAYGPQHTADPQRWNDLERRLRDDPIISGLQRTIFLNQNGEYIDREPASIADTIHEGAVWIDWCGWPMYWRLFFGEYTFPFLEYGFKAFADQLGITAYLASGRNPPQFEPTDWIYPRSLVAPVDVRRYPWFVANPYAPMRTGPDYVFASFALRHGTGRYIYAYGNHAPWSVSPLPSPNVDLGLGIDQVWPFVRDVLYELAGVQPRPPAPPPAPPAPPAPPGQPPPSQQPGGAAWDDVLLAAAAALSLGGATWAAWTLFRRRQP